MADFWTAPKTNWLTNDGIGYGDLNRIEQNIDAVRDATKRRVQGFGYATFNTDPSYDGYVVIESGSCYSENGVPINAPLYFAKNLTAWQQGNGVQFGCLAPGAVLTAHTWFYLFVISDPITGNYEYMIDDNPAGTHVASVVYTEKRYINCAKTYSAGTHSSFNLGEMYSTGDHVFINPMYADLVGCKFTSAGLANPNVYQTLILSRASGAGRETPDRNVLAQFNYLGFSLHCGLFSLIAPYTKPALFMSGGINPVAEVTLYHPTANGNYTSQFEIKVNAAGQISLAYYQSGGAGWVSFACNMFYDDRLMLGVV